MKPLNCAVIGCGMLARQMHLPNLATMQEAKVHTCCDINRQNLEACHIFEPEKLTEDFHAAIEDPEVEALIVATTEVFRRPILEAAAAARKPVYMEKPLADTMGNALAMQAIVRESGIPFCIGHNRRCSPAMRAAREIFVSHTRNPKDLGWRFERPGWEAMDAGGNPGRPVVAIRINDDWRSWKSEHLRIPLNRRVGLVLGEGTHFVDLANWFIDSTPEVVSCTGSGILSHVMVIHYANGGMASITMAGTGTFGYPKELLEAMGEGGMVACDHMLEVRTAGIAGAPPLTRYPMLHDRHPDIGREGGLYGWLEKKRAACEEAVKAGNPLLQFTAEPDKGHQHMLREFVREIRGEAPPVSPIEPAVLAMQTCLAAAKSYIHQRPVAVSEITPEAGIE